MAPGTEARARTRAHTGATLGPRCEVRVMEHDVDSCRCRSAEPKPGWSSVVLADDTPCRLSAHDDQRGGLSLLRPPHDRERGRRDGSRAADRHLEVSSDGRVAIVTLAGELDDVLATLLIPALTVAARRCDAIVLDLDRVTLLEHSALAMVCQVIDVLPHEDSCCIVAGRPSVRLKLSRWGPPSSFATFTSVGDALQARRFAEHGYGPGWRPAA